MKDYELLDMIGGVNEDDILAADRPVKRRPRWTAWAACAACAALILGAYPAYRALQPKQPPLHSYTIVEDGGSGPRENSGSIKTPDSGSGNAPTAEKNNAEDEPDVSAAACTGALSFYYKLVANGGISENPAWYAGTWLNTDCPDQKVRLTVAIVDDFRTPEMETQILEWCDGAGSVLFASVKYSYAYLIELQDQLHDDIAKLPESISYGSYPDIKANCLNVDIYGGTAPTELLTRLAELDPDGDAIRVQVHTGQSGIMENSGSGPEAGESADGASYSVPYTDAPVDQAPYDQYNNLFANAHLDEYPAWYGGAYVDHTDSGEPSRLVVCIVDGFRTPDLEQQIAGWCGEGVWAYQDVKYSRGYLQSLMEQLNSSQFLSVIEKDSAVMGFGVYEEENCIQMDCRSVPSDATLTALAELDPDGDAIQVRVASEQDIHTDTVKGPLPGGAQDGQPADDSADPPAVRESAVPAAFVEELPQAKQEPVFTAE